MRIVDLEIKGISANSKEIKPGFLFVAIKGNRQNGHYFIKEAISRGASIVVMQQGAAKVKIPSPVISLIVKDCRKFFAQATHIFYKAPSDRIKVVGITGTNGKTTISYLIEAIAKKAGYSCGVIGTINYRYKGKVQAARNTTPGSGELQSLLAKMRDQRVKYCAMEVSSHALDQERVAGINFRHAIFTNLTQDHLDYHKNFKNYFLAKAKLFSALTAQSTAIINNDDSYGRRIKLMTQAKVMTYGISNKSDLLAKEIKFGLGFTEFTLVAGTKNIRIRSRLIGRYNIYNILAAIGWAISEKIPHCIMRSAIEEFKNVPGRLERLTAPSGINIFVDYAHTPDALFNAISALRPLVKGRIVVIFGCGGERDKLKRPRMGKIVTELADFTIITTDNPRSENPGQIIRDIRKGIKKNNYTVILDRRQAIRRGLVLIKKEDCLLIAGKGHEDYQILKDKVLRFNDRKVAIECLGLKK